MTVPVCFNSLSERIDECGSFWSRPDKTHLAADDVPKLWKLVDTPASQHPSEPRPPGVVPDRPDGSRRCLGIAIHRPELPHGEATALLSHTLLSIQDGAARGDGDGCRDQQKHRDRQQEKESADSKIEGPLVKG